MMNCCAALMRSGCAKLHRWALGGRASMSPPSMGRQELRQVEAFEMSNRRAVADVAANESKHYR